MTLKLGDIAPNFTAQTTQGEINFHEWAETNWIVFFSHPADFTPVCTTELGSVAKLSNEFANRNAKTIAISLDTIASHHAWIEDINETQKTSVNFPIIADPDRKIAELYDLIHPKSLDNLTVRSVFIIDPTKKIRLTLTYPAATGRNFQELLRVLDALQLTDNYKVATPANWKQGDDVIITTAIQTVDIPNHFPKGHTILKPYLRYTPQPN